MRHTRNLVNHSALKSTAIGEYQYSEIYMYIYIYICVCVCVRARACACVCMYTPMIFLIIKANEMHYFSNLFDKVLYIRGLEL